MRDQKPPLQHKHLTPQSPCLFFTHCMPNILRAWSWPKLWCSVASIEVTQVCTEGGVEDCGVFARRAAPHQPAHIGSRRWSAPRQRSTAAPFPDPRGRPASPKLVGSLLLAIPPCSCPQHMAVGYMRTQSTFGLSTEGLDGARPPCRDAGSASVTTQWMTGCRSGDRSSPSHSSRPAQISRRCLSSAMPCTARTLPPATRPSSGPNRGVTIRQLLFTQPAVLEDGFAKHWHRDNLAFSRVRRKTRQGSCCKLGR